MNILFAALTGAFRGFVELLSLSYPAHQGLYHATSIQLSGQKAHEPLFSLLLNVGLLAGGLLYFWRDIFPMLQAMPANLKSWPEKRKTEKILFYKQLFLFPMLWILPIGGAVLLPAGFGEARLPLTIALLLLNGGILYTIDRLPRQAQSLTPEKAAIIGSAHLMSRLPGLSPISGTLFAGQALGQSQKASLLLAVLLTVPERIVSICRDSMAIAQAGTPVGGAELFAWGIGAFLCGIVAYFSICLMNGLLRRRKVFYLSYYVWLLAGIILMIWIRG